jgi:hypothetical protein
MKKLAILLAVLGVFSASAAWAAGPPPTTEEKAQIEKAVRDYVDGWYEGSVERMERALHPDLAKRSVVALPNGRVLVDSASGSSMIELTRVGYGKKMAKPGQKNQVVILDVFRDTASAKSVSPDYVDYIHLIRIGGQWRIINVLWSPREEKAQAPAP